MPGGDRTGPMGGGPMTGWGRGFCGESATSGVGRGRGRGWGHGWRHRFWATGQPGGLRGGSAASEPPTEVEQQALQREAAAIEADLERIRRRLQELESPAPDQD